MKKEKKECRENEVKSHGEIKGELEKKGQQRGSSAQKEQKEYW